MKTRSLALQGAVAMVLMSFASAGIAQMPHKDMPHGPGSQEMMQSMMKGMKDMQSMQMTGDTDRDFAQMMRMHHQHGIEMAQVELKNGKDAKMKEQAKKIIEAQRKEIKEFDDWLAKKK
jgi:uncharacterized protein (DUF305 family)